MNCLLKRRGEETLQGHLLLKDGVKIPFKYKEERARKYEEFNNFIQGMEFVAATATISTTASLALGYDEKVMLDNGVTLRIKRFEAVVNHRRASVSRNCIERWIIDLR